MSFCFLQHTWDARSLPVPHFLVFLGQQWEHIVYRHLPKVMDNPLMFRLLYSTCTASISGQAWSWGARQKADPQEEFTWIVLHWYELLWWPSNSAPGLRMQPWRRLHCGPSHHARVPDRGLWRT